MIKTIYQVLAGLLVFWLVGWAIGFYSTDGFNLLVVILILSGAIIVYEITKDIN